MAISSDNQGGLNSLLSVLAPFVHRSVPNERRLSKIAHADEATIKMAN
jgi:hypothetical protein